MKKSILIKKNEFSVILQGLVFQKYYPSWGELLEELWNKTKNTNFFGYLNKVRDKFKKDGVIYEGKLDFQ